jgi:hypothetical protein
MSKKETLADKAKKAGLPVQVVYNRKHAGWSEKKALSVPLRGYKKKEIAYKVEPKKVQTSAAEVKPVERKVPPTIPLPVEKYEAPKSNTFIYLSVVLVILVIFAIMST